MPRNAGSIIIQGMVWAATGSQLKHRSQSGCWNMKLPTGYGAKIYKVSVK
jgi:hypothetical protein